MSAAWDAKSVGNTTPLAHTCSGSDRLLYVVVISATNPATGEVTYNGVSMGAARSSTSISGLRRNVYRLIAPASGAHDIAVAGGGTLYLIAAHSATGIDQTTPERSGADITLTSATSNTVISRTLTTVAGDLVLDWLNANPTTDPVTTAGDANHTNRHYDGSAVFAMGSTLAVDTDTVVSYSWDGADTASMLSVALVPAAAEENDDLAMDVEPATVNSGEAIAPSVVVESSDPASTATVTASLASGGGSLSGTTAVAMVAGVATFANLIVTGAGSHTLQFTAPGHDPVVSSAFTVNSGGGGTPPQHAMAIYLGLGVL